MKRKTFLLFFALILLMFVTGCWSRRELNDLAIVGAIGIDKVGKTYEVSVQLMDPSVVKKPSGGRQPSVMYHARGETVSEAVRRMTTVTPRELYFSHIRMLILGEQLAKEGIRDTLDFLSRYYEFRTDFYIAVSKGTTAREVLGILTPLEKLPANNLFNSLKVSSKTWAPTTTTYLDGLISDLISEGKHPVLSAIRIRGDQEQGARNNNLEKIDSPSNLQYTGIAVFKKDRLLGWLNEEESKGYSYIKDKVKRTIGVLTCPEEGKISNEVIHSKTEVKGKVNNGHPKIDIHIRIEQNVQDVECNVDLTKTETIAELDKRANQKIEKFVEQTIESVQNKYKVDIFGFGEVIRRADPKAWENLKKDWDQHFTDDLQVRVIADIKTRRFGTVSNSFLQNMKE
ncbi:Spore germination protein B3 precursor [compost metagenome]